MRQVELFWMKISVTNKYCSLEIYYFLVFLLSLDFVVSSEYISPICLPQVETLTKPGDTVVTAGWGKPINSCMRRLFSSSDPILFGVS